VANTEKRHLLVDPMARNGHTCLRHTAFETPRDKTVTGATDIGFVIAESQTSFHSDLGTNRHGRWNCN
jgi:hypothetical protein